MNYELEDTLGDGSKPLLTWHGQLVFRKTSQPVALLLNRPSEILAIASQQGFQCFAQMDQAKAYIQKATLVGHAHQSVAVGTP